MTSRLLVFPAWRENPYLNLLGLAVRARGVSIRTATRIRRFVAETLRLRSGDAIHIHWTRPVCQTARTRAIAQRRLRLFTWTLRLAKRRGVRVLWTVHNLVSHETRHLDLELALSRFLTDIADDVIVLSPSTPRVVAPHFPLPGEKVRVLPHSSYWGVYPDEVTREEAREVLGIAPDTPVVGFVGQMRGYKGIPQLLAAMDAVRRDHPDAVLLLAGRADEAVRPLLDARASSPRLHLVDRFISDAELQHYFAASDVLVFPYERVLNSGSMFLSATFSRACILPAVEPLLTDFSSERWISFYDPAARAGMSDAIRNALRRSAEERESEERAARSFARSRLPWGMARAYDELLASSPGR